jgi:hypothetical protein
MKYDSGIRCEDPVRTGIVNYAYSNTMTMLLQLQNIVKIFPLTLATEKKALNRRSGTVYWL